MYYLMQSLSHIVIHKKDPEVVVSIIINSIQACCFFILALSFNPFAIIYDIFTLIN